MKKVVLASLLTAIAAVPAVSLSYAQATTTGTQAQAPAGAAAGGQVQMSQEEYAAYQNAVNQTNPAAKAAAFEAYLKAYPKSAVKAEVLNQMLYAYNQAGDQANALSAADRILEIDPNNLRALTLEVYYRRAEADKMTDQAAKTAALDKVAQYAQTGLNATKPASMSDADFQKLKAATLPTFESAIADDDMAKKDNAGAISAIKAELAADPNDTTKPSPVLQDVYVLAQAYYTSNPPDYLNCAWYATRAAAFAPDAYKPQIQPLATYCYTKYHGNKDGYDAMQTAVQTNLNPPAGFTVTPAPKPADIVNNLLATTTDLATLAPGDREYVLANGTPEQAEQVFTPVKGKTAKFPDVTVISATPDKLMIAVSDDAVQSKTADFEFDMKKPLTDKELPAAGAKVTVIGTYTSYTSKPIMIIMSDAELVLPKAAAPVHHTTHHTTRRR